MRQERRVRGGGSSHWDSAETAGENRVHCAPRTVRDDIEVFSSPACRRLHAVMDLGKCNRMQILYLYFCWHRAAWNNHELWESKQNLAVHSYLLTWTKWEECSIQDGLQSASGGWNGFSFHGKFCPCCTGVWGVGSHEGQWRLQPCKASLEISTSVLSFRNRSYSMGFITDQQ